MPGMIFSHIPIHLEGVERFTTNVHGHLHANRVRKINGFNSETGKVTYSDEVDPRYLCVCVEQTDFAPILFEDVKARVVAQGGSLGRIDANYDIEQED
jgi:hypothetical protein